MKSQNQTTLLTQEHEVTLRVPLPVLANPFEARGAIGLHAVGSV
jgi:hypothetical protein